MSTPGMILCPTCKGSGLQPKLKKRPKDNNDYGAMTMEDCRSCNGQGEIPGPPA